MVATHSLADAMVLTILKRNDLPSNLRALVGSLFRFDSRAEGGRTPFLACGRIIDAYTIGREEIDKVQKIQLKVELPSIHGKPVHSITLDLSTGEWTIHTRDGYQHPPYAEGTLTVLGRNRPEPDVDDRRVHSILHAAGLPDLPAGAIGAPFRFYIPEERDGAHYLAGVVVALEVNSGSATLFVEAPLFLGRKIVKLSYDRPTKWSIHFEGKEVETTQGALCLDLPETTSLIASAGLSQVG